MQKILRSLSDLRAQIATNPSLQLRISFLDEWLGFNAEHLPRLRTTAEGIESVGPYHVETMRFVDIESIGLALEGRVVLRHSWA